MSESASACLRDRSPRDLFAELALSQIPHLTHLVDRNPFSPTYGCFDREYWHYRVMDFPCGMSQESVLAFALLYRNAYPGSSYQGWERMREIAVAGLRFAMKAARRDGTCDDYYPYERAIGAMTFSTYACAEAYQLLELKDDAFVDFLCRRCAYLEGHNETGRLTNHQALTALAAYTVYQITGDDRHRRLAQDRVALTLSWQNKEEGWFQEYEGADPGYQTCTVDFLGKYHRKSGDQAVIEPLIKAAEFAWHFMHPDGSYAGEYGSRNSYHYYPHGFEILAPVSEKAAQLNDGFLRGAAAGKHYQMCDDRLCCHLVANYLQAYDDYHPKRAAPPETKAPFLRWFPAAGLAVCQSPCYYAVANLRKGGVTKVFSPTACVGSDTGLTAELDDGRVLVSHLMDDQHTVLADEGRVRFTVTGVFSWRSQKLATPAKLILFRLLNLTLGRFFPNLLRSLLQKMLITGKRRSPYRFKRVIEFGTQTVRVTDELPDAMPLRRLAAGSDATSIYVAASNVFQDSVLRRPWVFAPSDVIERSRTGGALWQRDLGEGP
ncbi:MAG: hypothetical protein A3K19_20380 [Lentisphaerae bacterium RIFOXYB12_FULL_65_16]|nr:MAG: hypothetical protein A3K18_32740 [Lentisphaerae bacterium RIFOXYA12_64_32]OGV89319.1 MAG: hypothetical protein A3K19_20380 [Lentisphaerae bacterium RIFOXYB12_FULL_65_16]